MRGRVLAGEARPKTGSGLAVPCQSLAEALALKGAARRRWQEIADLLTHTGRDRDWRRQPTVLERL